MARVLLVACPESYEKALPAHAQVFLREEQGTPSAGPDLVVIGPLANEPTAAAQRAARAFPGVDVLIAAESAEVPRLEALLRVTPFIPLRTALICCEPESKLKQAILNAINRCDFRQDHRRKLLVAHAALSASLGTRRARSAQPDELDRQRLARFFDFYDRVEPAVSADVLRDTANVKAPPNPFRPHGAEPAFPTQKELSGLARRALLDDDFEPYGAQLREVGRAHADLGNGFGAWLEIAHAFRISILRQLDGRSYPENELIDVILGMEGFVTATLREIGLAHANEQAGRLAGMAKNAGIFAAAVESSEDAIFTTTVDGVITAQNQAANRLVGASDQGGNNIARFANDASELGRCLTLAAGGTGTRALEMAWQSRGGRSLQVSLSVSPVLDESQRVVGLCAIARDITERKSAEAALLQSHKMEALGRLAGGVAHDFNNLLTIVLGHATFMQTPLCNPDTFAQDLQEIVDAAQRARSLTAQLLTFSRKHPLRPQSVDLYAAVKATHQLLHRTLPPNIDVSVDAVGSIWPVQMDPGHVDQLLMNLALNARDAMPSGGQLRIEMENQVVAQPTASLGAGNYVMLAVHDSGLGIEPEHLAVVFDPFFTTKGPGRGTGIGLATCYSIVRQAHGDIQVSSAVGRGTTFRVWLPRAAEATGERKRPSDPSRLAGQERVLLVEDDPAVRTTATRALAAYGYQVTPTADGEHALTLLREMGGHVDVIVSDVIMPRMNGPELARRVRHEYPHIPVLFITGFADESSLGTETLPEGARILLKPFVPKELARRVREALDGTGEPN